MGRRHADPNKLTEDHVKVLNAMAKLARPARSIDIANAAGLSLESPSVDRVGSTVRMLINRGLVEADRVARGNDKPRYSLTARGCRALGITHADDLDGDDYADRAASRAISGRR